MKDTDSEEEKKDAAQSSSTGDRQNFMFWGFLALEAILLILFLKSLKKRKHS